MACKSAARYIKNAIRLALSDHKGTGHKVAHNITTIANIPLVAWLIYSILTLRDADYEAFTQWISQPWNIIVGILFVIVTLLHFTLELEVVFQDYMSDPKKQHCIIKMMKFVFFVLGAVTIISILKLGLVL